MNSPLDDILQDHIEALLGGGLDSATTAALEARLRANAAVWDEYVALKAVCGELEDAGARLADAVPRVDLADDILLALDLETLGKANAAATPQADLLDDVLLRADLVALGEAHARAVPEIDIVADVMMQADLAVLGEREAQRAPKVDLVAAVMDTVRRDKVTQNVVPLRVRPGARAARGGQGRRRSIPWAMLAAAASLLVGVWLIADALLRPAQDVSGGSNNGHVASRAPQPGESRLRDGGRAENTIVPVRPSPVVEEHAALAWPDQKQPDQPNETPNPYAELTLQDILDARRNAIEGSGADRALLAHLASLTPEEARALLERSGLSVDAMLGAALFLPPDEAVNLLLSKLGDLPDDPYLRYALAKNLAEKDGANALVREQLAEWRRSDPDNGMPYFMEAEMLLREQDIQNALLALEQAQALGQSYGYSAATARYRQQALMAAGMGEEQARLLAASTAGSEEYLQIREMAKELLDFGRYYESVGDYETAQRIYDAVQAFGEDVAVSATFVNEELAGLETQHDALGNLRDLYEILGSPDTVQLLQDSFNLLAMAFTDLRQYIDTYNEVFASGNVDWINDIAALVMNQGDRNVVAQ